MDELDGPLSSSSTSSDEDDVPAAKRPRKLVANPLHKEGESSKNPAEKERNADDDDKDQSSDSDSPSLSDSEDGEGDSDLTGDETTDDEDADSNGEENEEENEEEPPVDEADALIQALRKSKEKRERQAPPEIVFENNEVVDISFHPDKNVVAAATMDGQVTLFEYTNEANKEVGKLSIHKKAVRSLEFDESGERLFSASKDKSLKVTDVETMKVKHNFVRAHDSSLYCVRPIGEHLCATGDEDGVVRLWDFRQPKFVMEAKKFDEFVSDFVVDDELKTLVASSGEGTLHSFNIRGKKPDVQSEVYEGELNCLGQIHKGNSKVVVGCGDGRLYMFNWGEFGYHSADFPGHPDAINDLIPVTENVIITGCEDGTIRAVHLYPHRFVGAVGHHEGRFPVEKLDVSSTGELVASISHDQMVKFWNISYLENMDYKKTKKPFFNRVHQKQRRKEQKLQQAIEQEHQLPSSHKTNKKDFFKELSDY